MVCKYIFLLVTYYLRCMYVYVCMYVCMHTLRYVRMGAFKVCMYVCVYGLLPGTEGAWVPVYSSLRKSRQSSHPDLTAESTLLKALQESSSSPSSQGLLTVVVDIHGAVCMYACIVCMYVCVCVYVCVYVCMYACTMLNVFVCIHLCIHVHYIGIPRTYIHTNIHTYIHGFLSP
jgi:hypothetical protein